MAVRGAVGGRVGVAGVREQQEAEEVEDEVCPFDLHPTVEKSD